MLIKYNTSTKNQINKFNFKGFQKYHWAPCLNETFVGAQMVITSTFVQLASDQT